jgi:hypothetical protein
MDGVEILDISLSGDMSKAVRRDKRSWESDVANEMSLKLSKGRRVGTC